MPRSSQFSPDVRERAIRMVPEQTAAHGSQWAAIRSIAEKLGCHPEKLRNWLRAHERDTGQRAHPYHPPDLIGTLSGATHEKDSSGQVNGRCRVIG